MISIKKIRSHFDSAKDVLLFLQIILFATALPLLIKILSVPRFMQIITPGYPASATPSDLCGIRDKIEKYTDYILSRNFWMYKMICLKRSLILYHFLRKYGMYVTVCFGVRYKNELSGNADVKKMEGHAWLLYNGEIFLEKMVEETKTYKVTYCYPENKDGAKGKGLVTDIEGLM